MVAPAVAAGLGLGEQQARSPEETVVGWLADRQRLLVLDNCEHVVDGVVALVEGLLAGGPRLVVLATSRARLQVPYEWVFPVPGLSVAADGDAVALFHARATAAGSPPDPADLARVAAVCDALDGTALAIARERDATAARHLAWCQEAGEALAANAGTDPVAWGPRSIASPTTCAAL